MLRTSLRTRPGLSLLDEGPGPAGMPQDSLNSQLEGLLMESLSDCPEWRGKLPSETACFQFFYGVFFYWVWKAICPDTFVRCHTVSHARRCLENVPSHSGSINFSPRRTGSHSSPCSKSKAASSQAAPKIALSVFLFVEVSSTYRAISFQRGTAVFGGGMSRDESGMTNTQSCQLWPKKFLESWMQYLWSSHFLQGSRTSGPTWKLAAFFSQNT